MASTLQLRNFIDGRWVDASTGSTFENIDPATGELIANVAKSSTADVDRAIEAARRSLDTWRLYPAPKRGEILYRAGEIALRRKDELAREMTREMGKVLAESRGDVQEGIDMTYYIAGEGRRQFGDVVPAELPNKWAMSMRHPVGVVAAITPWNFPFAIPTWKIMPALILGNTIVFKPASYTPLLAVRLVEILEEAGLPKGVLNLVLGSGGDLGDHLVSHPGVDLISFTGSSDTGSHISEIAGRLLKRVSCELGGKNAIVVLDDADVDLSLDGIVRSAFGTSGQRCTAASRVIVHKGVATDLVDKPVGRAKKLRLGNGLDTSTDVGPEVGYGRSARCGAEIRSPSGAWRRPVMVIARPAGRRSTCTPSGSRSTSTTLASCSARRSTTRRAPSSHPNRRPNDRATVSGSGQSSFLDRQGEPDLGSLADDARRGDRATVRFDE